ncbi:MAG: butyrate kinase [Bacteroidales bacterium]|nr:MAG: butyrate kinase [Bacteroidales bacterium]
MTQTSYDLSTALILTFNPREDHTQIAVYGRNKAMFLKRIRHSAEDLAPYGNFADQTEFRKEKVIEVLKENDIPLMDIKVVMGRGGLIKPVKSGIYIVNDAIKADLRNSELGEDVINLGGLVADALAADLPDAKAFIADPVVVDEYDELSRISGHPLFERKSIFHALNQKAVAREHAKSLGKKYEEMDLIVVNLGRGITVGAHRHGRVIDATQGYDGDGPFSPIGSGTLPMGDVVRACFSGEYTKEDMLKMVRGEGGLKAYLGTDSIYEVEKRILSGDKKAKLILDAMIYQVAKSVGFLSMAFPGTVDGILITGDIANDKYMVNSLLERVSKIAQVFIYPGDDELDALAMNGLMIMRGEAEVLNYK